jgi:hypothetical protein
MVVFVEYIIFTLIKTGAGIKVTVYIMGGMTILYTIFRVIVCPIIHYNMIDWDYSTTEGEIKLAIWDVLTELIIMAGIIALYVL